MEKLIVVAVIIVGSIIHSWIQRKQEEAAAGSAPPEPPTGRPPRPRASGAPAQPTTRSGSGGTNWEEEMRRLLQGEGPAPSSRPPLPPPVPRGVPAAPPPVLARSAIPVPDEGTEMEVGLPVRPVKFDQASSAHDRAQIQSMVAQRMQDTASRVSAHVGLKSQTAQSARAAGVRQLLRDRESQRNVILASLILGPPRALEKIQ